MLILALGACSFIVQNKTEQCQSDADCEHFGNESSCRDGVCVASSFGSPGCFSGDAGTTEQFEDQCTSSQCVKFDNCTRLQLCGDAALPALVAPPPSP